VNELPEDRPPPSLSSHLVTKMTGGDKNDPVVEKFDAGSAEAFTQALVCGVILLGRHRTLWPDGLASDHGVSAAQFRSMFRGRMDGATPGEWTYGPGGGGGEVGIVIW
jgi:hypothetical protein